MLSEKGLLNLKTNRAGLNLIEKFEGCILTAYRDYLGEGKYDVPTIGYGHTTAAGSPNVYMGMVITKDQADKILQDDLTKVEFQVSQYVTVPLNENQFSALVSFVFNLGAGNFQSSTLLRRLNAGDYDVGNEFLKWNKAQGVTLKGLIRRREAEKALWESKDTNTQEQKQPEQNPEDKIVDKPVHTDTPKLPEESPAQGLFLVIIQLLKSIFLAAFGVRK